MKLSIVIPVLDSHEIVKKQYQYWLNNITDEIEIILVDDGSNPSIEISLSKIRLVEQLFTLMFDLRIIETNDKSAWSEHMATNIGINYAKGEYILKTDIDHIITVGALRDAINFQGDCLRYCNRAEGTLNKDGYLVCTDTLRKPHSNTFVMKKSIFQMLGGYNEYGKGYYAGGSIDLWLRYMNYVNAGKVKRIEWSKEFIYVWPNSPITPTKDQHLFHSLRKTL